MKITPDDAVLIFGDFQEGITNLPLTVSADNIRLAAWGLARLGEIFDIPTFAMSIPKPDGGTPKIISEIRDTRSEFRTFLRKTPDSFEDEPFRQAIEATGRKVLIVGGIATEICLHWLVISGISLGYTVYVVADGCAGLGVRSEAAAFRRFEAAGAVMTSVVSLAGEIAGNFTRLPGSAALEVIYKFAGADLPRRISG